MSTVKATPHYKINDNQNHARLKEIVLENDTIQKFFDSISDVDVQRLEYTPFMRFYVARQLLEIAGERFQEELLRILHDRHVGGFTIGLNEQTTDLDDYIKFSTAISHIIGRSNFDAMSGKYYARFSVKHTDNSDTYLRKAYTTVRLHTDGTFVNEPTDWLLMMKFEEQNAVGGESRLLHLDDWEEREPIVNHPLSSQAFKFSYADRKSKNVDDEVFEPVFYKYNNHLAMRYNHQALQPVNATHALYLKEIQDSIENSKGTTAVKLPVGNLVVLNNHFWLHGREPFHFNNELYRELLRQRGHFTN